MGIVLDPTKCLLTHPNEEILEEYALHGLPEALTAQVEEHLLLCESCQNAVAGTDSFVAAMKIAVNRPALWRSVFPSLGNRTQLVPMAALVILGLVAIWPHRPEPSAPVSVSLSSLRGSSALAPAPAGKSLRLSIDLSIDQPDLAPAGAYRIEMVDAAGRPIWKGPVSDVEGKLVATLRTPLAKGVYWVRLYGANSELVREFGISAQ
jgi:hypothetical protein